MDPVFQDFCNKFLLDRLQVHLNKNWVTSIRPNQSTLGALIISARSGAKYFNELGRDELQTLGSTFASAENVALKYFGANRINILCLMMKDPIVHFHVFPRYRQPVHRFGLEWVDVDWPGPPILRDATTADHILVELVTFASAAFSELDHSSAQ
jgi:diadenosine tetraphosphate (Ap4A) HIT family hydrolase